MFRHRARRIQSQARGRPLTSGNQPQAKLRNWRPIHEPRFNVLTNLREDFSRQQLDAPVRLMVDHPWMHVKKNNPADISVSSLVTQCICIRLSGFHGMQWGRSESVSRGAPIRFCTQNLYYSFWAEKQQTRRRRNQKDRPRHKHPDRQTDTN